MALTFSTQAEIAFKNLFGKSHTENDRGIYNEYYGISTDISYNNIWTDVISDSPEISILQGVAIEVIADLSQVSGSNNHSFLTLWPTTTPNEIDVKTGLSFSYGLGSLVGLTAGDRITGVISNSYGFTYSAILYSSHPTEIPFLDSRDWVYQYNSGILYQENTTGVTPTSIKVYVYTGNKLETSSEYENIRVSALGTNDYYATYSFPIISTYSSNYLFLVDFQNTNTSGTVSLNINSLGTFSVKVNSGYGLNDLNVSDITGGTGSPIYYLVYNNGYFEFHNSYPSQSSLSYTKLMPTTKEVGQLEVGASFNNVNLKDVFSDILYGEQLGNVTSFTLSNVNLNTFEVGDSMIPQAYTFSWVLSNPSLFVEDTVRLERLYYGNIDSGLDNTSDYSWILSSTISYTSQNNEIFNLYIDRTNGTTIRKSINVDWRFPIYVCSTSSTMLSGSDFPNNYFKILATNSNFITNISGNGYKYIAVPEEFSAIYLLTNTSLPVVIAEDSEGYTYSEYKLDNYSVTVSSLNFTKIYVTGSYGIGATYNLYRTLNSISVGLEVISNMAYRIY
jgi:hypothetical protein